MHIVLFATEWGTAKGGVNSFNISFATAIAQVGAGSVNVTCAITGWTESACAKAEVSNVRLVGVSSVTDDVAGREVIQALRTGASPAAVDYWVGHDVVTGHAAVAAAAAHGGRAVLIHHMHYESYKNLAGGQGEKAAAKHDSQISLFSSPGVLLFGVGTDLAASVRRLGAAKANEIIPGFPDGHTVNSAGHDDLFAIVAGRFDASSERLKQSQLAAASLGRAVWLADGKVAPLRRPTLSVFGATATTIRKANLEVLARRDSSRFVNVIPARFNTSNQMTTYLSRANLALMPSVREGFGLVGWEAIGCDVPLILGEETGLNAYLNSALDGRAERWVKPVSLTGMPLDERDIAAMAGAILKVAEDLEFARIRAVELRRVLKGQLQGCTWGAAAQRFLEQLEAFAGCVPPASGSAPPPSSDEGRKPPEAMPPLKDFVVTSTNHRRRCADLRLGKEALQGSTPSRFDVLPSLRFGTMEYAIDDLNVAVGLRRALVHVSSDHGWIGEERLDEREGGPPGVAARAGDVWEITDPDGGVLNRKVLGDEALCRVETPPNHPLHAKVEVTASKSDVVCTFSTKRNLKRATEQVMRLFLERALFETESGHIVLSKAEMHGE